MEYDVTQIPVVNEMPEGARVQWIDSISWVPTSGRWLCVGHGHELIVKNWSNAYACHIPGCYAQTAYLSPA